MKFTLNLASVCLGDRLFPEEIGKELDEEEYLQEIEDIAKEIREVCDVDYKIEILSGKKYPEWKQKCAVFELQSLEDLLNFVDKLKMTTREIVLRRNDYYREVEWDVCICNDYME